MYLEINIQSCECQKSRTLSYIYCSTIKEGISHFGLILSTPSFVSLLFFLAGTLRSLPVQVRLLACAGRGIFLNNCPGHCIEQLYVGSSAYLATQRLVLHPAVLVKSQVAAASTSKSRTCTGRERSVPTKKNKRETKDGVERIRPKWLMPSFIVLQYI